MSCTVLGKPLEHPLALFCPRLGFVRSIHATVQLSREYSEWVCSVNTEWMACLRPVGVGLVK
jgi:hypothetical protein